MAEDPVWLTKFRRRFRVPYRSFVSLLSMARANEANSFFSRWTVPKVKCTQVPSPIELLILGTLHYLGRGWTFDDLEEATGIGEETHRVFFSPIY